MHWGASKAVRQWDGLLPPSGIEVSEEALDLLGEAGFDPVYGARPLKRAIQRQLENPLANELLSSRLYHQGG